MISLSNKDWLKALDLQEQTLVIEGFERVSTDSRDCKGAVFFALKGERFDAHDFVKGALDNGASLCVVERLLEGVDAERLLVVDDVLLALQKSAQALIRASGAKCIALSGSNGKTTTKELMAAALLGSVSKEQVHKTAGNLNNHIGVPLTAFALKHSHDFAIFEMGMNHFGEIECLRKLVEPDIALLTSIGSAHAENLGGVKGVERAKGELFEGLKKDAIVLVNSDDEACVRVAKKHVGSSLTFGQNKDAQVRVLILSQKPEGLALAFEYEQARAEVLLPMSGLHNATNAAGAIAMCIGLGLDFEKSVKALAGVEGVSGRLSKRDARCGAVVLDDTYNANPDSMKAGLETLVALASGKRTIAALGEMKEVFQSERAHRLLGEQVAAKGVSLLFCEGAMGRLIIEGAKKNGMKENALFWAEDSKALAPLVLEAVRENDVVLAKGSRSAKMERVVAALCDDGAGALTRQPTQKKGSD